MGKRSVGTKSQLRNETSGVLQKKITAGNCIDQKATRKDFERFRPNKKMNFFLFPFFEDIKKWQTSGAIKKKKQKDMAKWTYERLAIQRIYACSSCYLKGQEKRIVEPRCLKAIQ